MLRKNIAILGSTGSIGKQTLEVVEAHQEQFAVKVLAAHSNIELLEKQTRQYRPKAVIVTQEEAGIELRRRLQGLPVEVIIGLEGLIKGAEWPEVDMVVTAVMGTVGLLPTLAAIRSGKDIALANKETLVAAGALVMEEARQAGVSIIPVDSEHSAIFQCLQGHSECLRRLLLTASGGPFRGFSIEQLEKVTPEMALKHPNWSMGAKITVDSASLMNKGLEVIEARWLFDIDFENIHVVIHPQSIIHSMVEYQDGSLLAHLGPPDMRIPIQYALTFPKRIGNPFPKLDLTSLPGLTFEPPDRGAFPALELAYQAGRTGGTLPAVLNGANEIAVSLFLDKRISFRDIPRVIAKVMDRHTVISNPSMKDILAADFWAREQTIHLA